VPIPDFQSFLLPVLQLASDGNEHFPRYMVDFDLGVVTKDTYVVKRIDSDFFQR
jgi:restriction endonuclease Mrr